MIEAAELAQPDLIICPFLTKHVPPKIYTKWMTLIVHPGPPGDAGPSAIDWCLIGDMGELEDADQELTLIDAKHSAKNARSTMRSHWGVTVLQAIEAFDAGPVWAFDQFELGASNAAMSKSDLYRGPVTRAAVKAVLAAVDRIIVCAEKEARESGSGSYLPISASVAADPHFRTQCVSAGVPFLGGRTHDRPLLRASQRDFFPLLPQSSDSSSKSRLSVDAILQRIRSADSQPGMLSTLLGTPLFLYNAHVQRDPLPPAVAARQAAVNQAGTVLATREGAILVDVGADFPLWIGHLRRPKAKADKYLHPKLPAVMALLSIPKTTNALGLLDANKIPEWSATSGFGSDPAQPWKRRPGTYQQVWVDIESSSKTNSSVAYIHADFYNGAFSTTQCEILLEAIQWTLNVSGLKAVVMLGGPGYFSNGIALNVIEGSDDSSADGWANINAIDDCVQALLAPKGILTFAAVRGNVAAGGLAMATAADFVICAESAVLNPHYRGLGLYGSEWHTYSWYERCGPRVAAKFAREMLPMSSREAKKIGLVDHVLESDGMNGEQLLDSIKQLVNQVMDADMQAAAKSESGSIVSSGAPWTRSLRPASADASQSTLLSEQILRNKTRYLAYLFAESAEGKSLSLEEHFLRYRKQELDQMTLDFFHPHRNQRFASRCTGFVRKLVATSTPMRFALHRRCSAALNTKWWNIEGASIRSVLLDEEEQDEFDGLAQYPPSAAVARLPAARPEFVLQETVKERFESRTTRAYSVGQDTLASMRSGENDAQTSHFEGSQRSSMSTAPTTPRDSSPKPVLSLGDEQAQRVEVEAEQLVIQRGAANLGSVDSGAAVKRGPTVVSFAGAEKEESVDKKMRTGVKAPSERSTAAANATTGVSPASPGKDSVKSQSKIQRFFQSLGRKHRGSLRTESQAPIAAAATVPASATPLASAFESKLPSAPSSPDAATRQRRRASVTDVLSILQNGGRVQTGNNEPNSPSSTASKADRRRSWRPTSSSSLERSLDSFKSCPPTPSAKATGFQPNVAATPKIVEEAFALTISEKADQDITPAVESGDANCLWSCYYSEDGDKQQRPINSIVQPLSAA